jgi:hypothetical protein
MASNLQTNQSNSTAAPQSPGVTSKAVGTSTQTPTDIIGSKQQAATGAPKRYEFLQDEPRFFVSMGVGDFKRLGPFDVAKTTNLGQVVLPIPAGLMDSNHVEYSTEELKDAGAAAVAAAGGAKEGGNVAGASATVAGIGAGAVASATGAAVSKALGGGNVNEAAAQIFGLTKNNFQVISLKGPAYKKHEMNWKLAPKSQAESDAIRDMIIQLNNWAAPGLMAGGAYFTFPKVFNITFVGTDYLFKFKPAVCTDVSVNYTASGIPSFYKNGAPESIQLKLSFQELEYWLEGQFGY